MKLTRVALWILILALLFPGTTAWGAESVWIEAEHLRGVRGSCFPDMDQKTAGHWALSGPGGRCACPTRNAR